MKNKIGFCIVTILAATLVLLCAITAANTAVYADFSYDNEVININSDKDFADFYSASVTNGYDYSGKTVRLNCDVDGSVIAFTGYLPNFGGVFDGGGHSVKNLKNRLFGTIAASGTVKNVYFKNVSAIGFAIAGLNAGKIIGVSVSGTISPELNYRAGLVGTNTGEIIDCDNICTYVSSLSKAYFSGVACVNKGTITGCYFGGKAVANFNNDNSHGFAGISYDNYGTVSRSTVAATLTYSGSNRTAAEQDLYAVAKNGTGTVTDAYAIIDDKMPSDVTVNIAEGMVTNVNAVISKTEKKYYATADGTISETAVIPDFSAGAKNVLDGQGTIETPFLLNRYTDLSKLKFIQPFMSGVYELDSDIYLSGESKISVIDGFDYNPGSVDGNGYALIGGETDGAFDAAFNLTGENVGFISCLSATLSGNTNDGYVDFSDFGKGATVKDITASEPSGTGTELDPYIVSKREELKALDGKTGYAVLSKDVVVNSKNDGGNLLNVAELKLNFNGNGHSIIGLTDENLTTTLSGTISNLKVRSTGNSGVCENNGGSINRVSVRNDDGNYGICKNNYGNVSYAEIYGKYVHGFVENNEANGVIVSSVNYSETSYAFAKKNDGNVNKCENKGSANKVFDTEGTGVVSNSVNYALSADVNYRANNCFEISSAKSYVKDGVKYSVSSFDYVALKKVGFDFDNTFGYVKGEDNPSLRKDYTEYKTAIKVITGSFVLDYSYYDENTSYEQNVINETITNINGNVYENTVYNWTFNGEPLTVNIKNAGDYLLTARFAGTNDYLAAEENYSLTIDKAVSTVNPEFIVNEFSDFSAIYSGENVSLPTVEPDNFSVLQNMGFTQKYVLTKDGNAVSAAVRAGEYRYTTVFSSDNYFDMSASVKLTVEKKELFVTVKDGSCYYNSEFDLSTCDLTITGGLVSADDGKTISLLTPDYKNGFSTDYVAGNPVGNYTINFTGVADDYYYTVTAGVLKVNRIAVPVESIDFYGATGATEGSFVKTYDGAEVTLTATLSGGVTAAYENNVHKDAGVYLVRGTFTIDENYIPLELTVRLEIKKAVLTVAAPDGNVEYGTIASLAEPVTVSGFVNGETVISVFGSEFNYKILDGENEVTGVYDAGTYLVKVITKSSPNNYDVTYKDGVFKIEKVSLKRLKNNVVGVSEKFLDGEKIYDGTAEERKIDFFTAEEVDVVYSVTRDGAAVAEIKNAGGYLIEATVTPKGVLAKNYLADTYVCRYVVKKIKYNLTVEKEKYSFVYDGSDKAVLNNFSYSGLPDGKTVRLECTRNSVSTEAVRAGVYSIGIIFDGGENEEAAAAYTELEITKKAVTVNIKTEYDYVKNGKITIEIISIDGAVNEELTADDVLLGYRNALGQSIPSIISAGNYYVDIAVRNTDYSISNSTVNITVNKLTIPFTLGSVSYVYGTVGNKVIDGVRYEITENTLTVKSYPYSGETFDITVRTDRNAGVKTVTAADVILTTNYDFVPEGKNEITITARELLLVWKVDGTETSSTSYEAVYSGRSQNGRFSYNVGAMAFDDKASDLSFVNKVSGGAEDIYNVGSYGILATLYDNVNYKLTNDYFTVRVKKAALTIEVDDAEVWQRERYTASYRCYGKVGDDINKTAPSLKGANIRINTSYTETAPVGSIFDVTITAAFDNYEAEVTKTGKITVVSNPYPDYLSYWHDVNYVYTGSEIRAEIASVSEDVTVVYSNNAHTNAGVYTAGVTVTYPTGRTQSGNCIITIVPANPVVTVPDSERLFTEGYSLAEGDIVGTASYNGNPVSGRFVPDDGQVLKEGKAAYGYTFVPDDDRNFNKIYGSANIRTARITLADFTFDNPDDISFLSDGRTIIYGAVKMRINPILDGLVLRRNGNAVDYIEFTKTETVAVTVTLGEQVAFNYLFDVTYKGGSAPVIITKESFSTNGVTFNGNTLEVGKEGGRLSLKDEYKGSYGIYVNGYYYEELIINGDEEEIVFFVKNIGTGKNVFGGRYAVKVVEEQTPDVKPSYTLYFIIGGSVAGVAAIIAVVLIIWRKKHG